MSEAKRSLCVLGEYCHLHNFIHGAEAEELRKRIEGLINNDGVTVEDLQRVLDEVDARDSVAYLEHRQLEESIPK